MGAVGLRPTAGLFAQGGTAQFKGSDAEYDAFAKLASNENNWGPPEAVMKAMTNAWKYANRYGYPDGNIVQAIADHHRVKPENILLTAGSSEVLQVVGTTFLQGGKKVLGVDPSYASVYQHASNIKAEAIKLPLTKDYRQDIGMMIEAANKHASELGFVYLCNPNNPTGVVVTAKEVKQLLDGIPKDMPVLIDEAYHHFVDDPAYGTSVPYVLEGRPVVIARTFSKIAALAAMRLGYAVATPEIVQRMRPYSMGSVNALAKWGGVASIKDAQGQADVKAKVDRAPQQDDARARGARLSGHSVADQLLHGEPRGPQRAAGDRRVPHQGHPRRPSVPADGAAPARVGRRPRRDGPLPQGVQGDLPQEGRDDDGSRMNFGRGRTPIRPPTPGARGSDGCPTPY